MFRQNAILHISYDTNETEEMFSMREILRVLSQFMSVLRSTLCKAINRSIYNDYSTLQ